MQRYHVDTKVTVTRHPIDRNVRFNADSVIKESPTGEFVKWSDAEEMRLRLVAQIPELRIAKLEHALGLVAAGKCPECGQHVQGYKSPEGTFAPEAFATLRERSIDPCTGHKYGCSRAGA